MSQTAPPPDSDAPRPLPRRPAPRPPAARANRPRFAPLDAVWLIVLVALSLALSARWHGLSGEEAYGSLAAAGTVAALYLLGWRARDRAAGASAGLLAATSLPFLSGAAHAPLDAAFTLLTVAALFAFVAGSSLAALALAAVATLVRPEGALLGLLLMALALAQQRKRAVYGVAVFLVPLLALWSGRIASGHGPPPPARLRPPHWAAALAVDIALCPAALAAPAVLRRDERRPAAGALAARHPVGRRFRRGGFAFVGRDAGRNDAPAHAAAVRPRGRRVVPTAADPGGGVPQPDRPLCARHLGRRRPGGPARPPGS